MPQVRTGVPLAGLTTLGVGGPAQRLVEVTTADELVEAVREADADGRPLLVLGGGSNVVVADAGVPGDAVHVRSTGVDVDDASECAGVTVRVQAGHVWDDLVAQAVAEGWTGIEALSGIPGTTGATPLQNVGAYGQEVSTSVATVRVYDRDERRIRTFANADCGFGYRSSVLRHRPRFVVLEVVLQLGQGSLGAPVAYAELADRLDVPLGGRAALADVREAVLALRRGKAMVVDPADPDSRSTGSFFTNPILDAAAADRLPEGAPRWPQPDGRVKTSAAWLLQQAGIERGAVLGGAAVSRKHVLAITARDGASADDVIALAVRMRTAVLETFGVTLEVEPVLVGCGDELRTEARR